MTQETKTSFEHWTSIVLDAVTEQPCGILIFDNESSAKNVIAFLQSCDDLQMEIIEKLNGEVRYTLYSDNFKDSKFPSLTMPKDGSSNIQSFLNKAPFDKSFLLVPMIVHNNQSSKLSPLSDYIVPVTSYTYHKENPIPYNPSVN